MLAFGTRLLAGLLERFIQPVGGRQRGIQCSDDRHRTCGRVLRDAFHQHFRLPAICFNLRVHQPCALGLARGTDIEQLAVAGLRLLGRECQLIALPRPPFPRRLHSAYG